MAEVQEIDLSCPRNMTKVHGLIQATFGKFPEGDMEHILLDAPSGTVGYAVFDGADLVAFNAFIGHAVHRNGEIGTAYQSCMSATRSDQKGKGHFSHIINHAKQALRAQGGKFIFGFPNHNSGPIFVKKLGFSLSDNRPCIYSSMGPFALGSMDQSHLYSALASTDLVNFDAYETADWKIRKRPDEFFHHEALCNYIFGQVVERKVCGVNLRILAVGGYEINKPFRWNAFLKAALKMSRAHLIRMNANEGSPVAHSSVFKRSGTLTEPTIACGLNWDVTASQLDAFGGLKDVY